MSESDGLARGADDQPPVDPAESMRLIREERQRAEQGLGMDPRLLSWPWGIAWLVGFGLFFLRYGPDERVFVDLPPWLPLAALFVLLAGAAATYGISIGRGTRGVRGTSAQRGWAYGLAFFLGAGSVAVTISRVDSGLSEMDAGLLWAASMVGLVGALHIAGGAIWLDWSLSALGGWILLTNIAGVLAGPGWHSLVVALAGGGGMLVAGLIGWRTHVRAPAWAGGSP